MKKIILTILVLALSSITLVGCINVLAHKQFSDPWSNYEKATYSAVRTIHDKNADKTDDVEIKGETIIITERVNKGTVQVGEQVINDFTGTIVTVDTLFDDGSLMKSAVAFKVTLEPVASYKHIDVKGEYANTDPAKPTVQTSTIAYSSKKADYTSNIDGTTTTGQVKLDDWIDEPYYDNLMVYHIARASYKYEDDNLIFNALPVNVVSTSTNALAPLSLSKTGAVVPRDLTKPDGLPVISEDTEDDAEKPEIAENAIILNDLITISLNQTFPGSGKPLTALFSTTVLENKAPHNGMHAGMDFTEDRRLVQFTEGSIIYTLKAFTEIKA